MKTVNVRYSKTINGKIPIPLFLIHLKMIWEGNIVYRCWTCGNALYAFGAGDQWGCKHDKYPNKLQLWLLEQRRKIKFN